MPSSTKSAARRPAASFAWLTLGILAPGSGGSKWRGACYNVGSTVENHSQMTTSLDQLDPGSKARLRSLGGERSFRRRLMEMGLLPGTDVSVVRKVGVGGVMELEVRRCRVSLRLDEARALVVEEVGER